MLLLASWAPRALPAGLGEVFGEQASQVPSQACGPNQCCNQPSGDGAGDPQALSPEEDPETNDDDNPCKNDGSGPAALSRVASGPQAIGNPINLATGNKYQKEVDLPALPGTLGLEVVRHYNSEHTLHTGNVGVVGRGWRLSYEARLNYLPDQNRVALAQADGRVIHFQTLSASKGLSPGQKDQLQPAPGAGITQRFVAVGGVFPEGILDQLQSGLSPSRLQANNNLVQWQWRWPSGRVLQFNARGSLVGIQMPAGHELLIQRDLEDRILRITDPFDRELRFIYGPKNDHGYRPLYAIETPVGRFEYIQQGGTGMAMANLVQVNGPAQDKAPWQRRYHYENPYYPSALTGISATDSTGQWFRWRSFAYAANGRADQTEVNGQPLQFQLTGRRSDGIAFSSAVDAFGEQTHYKHQLTAGGYRLVQASGSTCQGCSPAGRQYRYDSLGRLVEMQVLGPSGGVVDSTQYVRDAWGRLVEKQRNKQWVVRYQYADQKPGQMPASRPIKAIRPSVLAGKTRQTTYTFNELGQVLSIKEQGWRPGFEMPDGTQAQARPIHRQIDFAYQQTGGVSVLAQIDGPLPNGPAHSPADSDITQIAYTGRGLMPTRFHRPGAEVTQLQYDAAGRLQSLFGPNGSHHVYQYNSRGVLTLAASGGVGWANYRVSLFQLDPQGRILEAGRSLLPATLVAQTRETSQETSQDISQDISPFSKKALAQITKSYQAGWRQSFDQQGRLNWQANSLGMLSYWNYNAQGLLVHKGQASSRMNIDQQYEYDKSGRLVSFIDSKGRRLRVQAAMLPSPQQPVARALAQQALTANRPHSVLADDFGRQVWAQSPHTGISVYYYNQANQLVGMQDANLHEAFYSYDSAGRITKQVAVDARDASQQVMRWFYQHGRLVRLDSPHQTQYFDYDKRGFINKRTVALHPPPQASPPITQRFVTTYEHDESGQLVARTLPDGSRLAYQRNGQGQVVGLTRERSASGWSGWLLPGQNIVSGLQRDLKGLSSYVYGNGIQVQNGRLANGDLTDIKQVATSQQDGLHLHQRHLWSRGGQLLYKQTQWGQSLPMQNRAFAYNSLGQLVVAVASQGSAANPNAAGPTTSSSLRETQVWRYGYDAAQRLLLQQSASSQMQTSKGGTSAYGYQGTSYRLAGVQFDSAGQPLLDDAGNQYTWDAFGRLVKIKKASGQTAHYWYDHRGLRIGKWVEMPANSTATRPSGKAEQMTHYLYSPDGSLLAEVDLSGTIARQYINLAGTPLAVVDNPLCQPTIHANSFKPKNSFNCLEKRIHQALLAGQPETTHWLHLNHLGAPIAATNQQGKLVWQADYSPFGQAVTGRFSVGNKVADYKAEDQVFELNLRLPGQYFDAETGLHYNRARYYNPAQARYLSPDPLGTPDGPNPYAYVAYNPVRYVDPTGLVLFAFDGTGNADDPSELQRLESEITNVVRFRDAYKSDEVKYVSGVGTLHKDEDWGDIKYPALFGVAPDSGINLTGRERIDRMFIYFLEVLSERPEENVELDIDVVGFSRGAAQAREFVNLLLDFTDSGVFRFKGDFAQGSGFVQNFDECQKINLRFLGLFDTVLSTTIDRAYRLGIPNEVQYVAHAVALNEFRTHPFHVLNLPLSANYFNETRINLKDNLHWGGFPLESIGGNSVVEGKTRVELGFVGAHADIGGSYAEGEGQLSFVALNWMVAEAEKAGVEFTPLDEELPIVDPVIHDQANTILLGNHKGQTTITVELPGFDRSESDASPVEPGLPEAVFPVDNRLVRGSATGNTTQREMTFGGPGPSGETSLVSSQTHQFIDYFERPLAESGPLSPEALPDQIRDGNKTGTVKIGPYINWLRCNGYSFKNQPLEAPVCEDVNS